MPEHQAPARIDPSTFGGLLADKYDVAAWCSGCRPWATCDLAMLVRNGLGDRKISRCKPSCRKCGNRGEWHVSPPQPRFEGATWMQ